MRTFIVLIIALLGFSSFAQDQKKYGIEDSIYPVGLQVGEKAILFNSINQNDEKIALKKVLKDGPVVLMFYRGSWCPYCSRQLSNLSDSLALINTLGATVVAVSPESMASINQSLEGYPPLEISIISDSSGIIMEDYGVLFTVTEKYQAKVNRKLGYSLEEHNSQPIAKLPIPATYIINMNGNIIYRFFDVDYRKRAPVSAILEALKNDL